MVSPDGKTLFVSLWGGAKVLMFDAGTLGAGEVAVGEHPNAMVLSATAAGCSSPAPTPTRSGSSTSAAKRPRADLGRAVPDAPPASTPNALALSPDGTTLLVANADNNTVAVVDVTKPGASVVKGFIPTGWYPTGVAVQPRRQADLRPERQRADELAEPARPAAGGARLDGQYIGAHAAGRAVGRAGARRGGARAHHAPGLRADAVHRRAPARAGRRAGRRRRSPARRRHVADQARLLRHPREPHLRSGSRRPAAGQRRSVADAVRRGGHAQRARARARVRALRQLLRRRRRQLRRPRVLDRRLRDRRRREDVADELRRPRRRRT